MLLRPIIILAALFHFGCLVCAGVKIVSRSKRAAIGPKWPHKRIAFAFDSSASAHFNEPNRRLIKHALKLLQESLNVDGETCVEFVERTNQTDYIYFVNEDGCFTYVGYRSGKNTISLGPKCIDTGTIIHEAIHKLGFDHEHSRSDRDENIEVRLSNTDHDSQFNRNNAKPSAVDTDTPYDFHSIMHYTTYQASNGGLWRLVRPVVLSKPPVLVSDLNEIEFESELLTPIDVFKLQRFYGCRTIPIPVTVDDNNGQIVKDRFEAILKRFTLECLLKGINETTVIRYLNKTMSTCGHTHYWPVNYPIVENNHPLYKLMCKPKKKKYQSCKFSFECLDDKTVCIRPFYWPTGFCAQAENKTLNKALQKGHDVMIEFAHKIKSMLGNFVKVFS